MTRRLLLSYLGLAVLILVLLEVPLGILAQRHEHDVSASQAAREAAGLAGLASEDLEHDQVTELATLATTYRNSTGGEVAIIAPTGQVLVSSARDPENDAAHDWPHLVQAALKGLSVSSFGSDEGRPWAAAAAPITIDSRPAGVVLLATPASATVGRVHDIWWALAALAGAVLLVTAGVGLLLARSLSRPLNRLGEAVAALGSGDLAVRAAEDEGPPEIRQLGREFNHTAARLEELVMAQARFVADASHQLRSPLTALRLRLENLQAGTGEDASEAIAAAGGELRRLSRIVDGLLTLSRAGHDQPHRELVDLDAVVSDRCEAWAALADERGVTLQNRAGPARHSSSMLVPGDLEQMLDNLLANALDASPAGTTIRVTIESVGTNQVGIHVADEGAGMTEADRRRAFDRFWRGAASNGGSSGLGLAIVKQLATRNDSEVDLRPGEPTGLDAVITFRTVTSGRRRHVHHEEVS